MEGRSTQEELVAQLSQLRQDAAAQLEMIAQKDAGITALTAQMQQLEVECTRLEQESRLKSGDVKAALQDLGSVVKANQTLNTQLMHAQVCSFQRCELTETQTLLNGKSEELGRALARLGHLEQLLQNKDRERGDLLATYRAAAQETDRHKVRPACSAATMHDVCVVR